MSFFTTFLSSDVISEAAPYPGKCEIVISATAATTTTSISASTAQHQYQHQN